MKLRIALLCLCVLTGLSAFGQVSVSRYDNFTWVIAPVTGVPLIRPMPYVTVAVCSYPATGLPCTNTVTLYTDSTGTTPCNGINGCSNPMTTGSDGTFGFWIPAGHYQYTVSNGSTNLGTFDITIGGGGGGSSIAGLSTDGNFGIQVQNAISYGTSLQENKSSDGTFGQYTIVKLDSSGNVVATTTSDTGALGIANQASSVIGTIVPVATHGVATCYADNTVTAGDLIGIGTTTAGYCLDLGTSAITSVTYTVGVLGRAVTAATAGSTFTLELYGPYTHGAQATGSGGSISGLTSGVIPKATSSSTIGNSSCDDGITTSSTFTCSETIASSGTNGGVSAVEGTGAGVATGSGIDAFIPNASNHCWQLNQNGVAGGCLADTSSGQTITNKTFDTANNTFQTNGTTITGAGTPILYWDAGAVITWTAQPAALTEFASSLGFRRFQYNLAPYTQFRLVLAVPTGGATSAALRVQYSTNSGSTWSYLETGGGTTHSVNYNTAGSPLTGSWVNIDAGAKADVQLRVVGINGDGSTSPTFNYVAVELK